MDPAKLMSMQEDAHSRKISSEVMKQCLYESVIASPYRRQRRMSMRPNDYRGLSSSTYSGAGDGDTGMMSYSRMVQSMPVTPAQSQTVTPAVSPTTLKRFRAFTSRCATPDEGNDRSLEVAEDSWKGLASLFKPCPRYISASRGVANKAQGLDTLFDDMCEPESMELSTESVIKLDAPPRRGHHYRPT